MNLRGSKVVLRWLRGGSEGLGSEHGVWGSHAALPRSSLGIHGILGHPELGGNENPRGDGVLLPPAPPEECASVRQPLEHTSWETFGIPARDKTRDKWLVPRAPGLYPRVHSGLVTRTPRLY